jgi:hypothetical protein
LLRIIIAAYLILSAEAFILLLPRLARFMLYYNRQAKGITMSTATVFCSRCGTNNWATSLVCANCGAGLPTANSSGRGAQSVVPEEIKRWNWGAFCLHWIWGIGNRVWITFLILIPGFISGMINAVIIIARMPQMMSSMTASRPPNFIALNEISPSQWILYGANFVIQIGFMIVFGIKGSEWAWRNRFFEGGVEQFREVQRIWAIWGIILLIVGWTLGGLSLWLLHIMQHVMQNMPFPTGSVHP